MYQKNIFVFDGDQPVSAVIRNYKKEDLAIER